MIVGLGLSVFIGVTLGLLGGGGSILTLPVLLYVLDVAPKPAITMSLLVVGTTSLAALIPHAMAHHVRWKTGFVFGVSGMAGAYLGGRLSAFVPSDLLIAAFIAMMVATGLAMWRKPDRWAQSSVVHQRSLTKIVLDGLIIGLVTGLVGAGGGFLVVPALVLLGGLSMPVAIGTSLMVIAMKSFAGFAGYISYVEIDLVLAGYITIAAVVGSFIGALFVHKVNPGHLRRGFAVFVVAMAGYMSVRELPALLGDQSSEAWWMIGIAVAGFVIGTRFFTRWKIRRMNRIESSSSENDFQPTQQTIRGDQL